MCDNGFPIKDFGNDDYCNYYLLGLVLLATPARNLENWTEPAHLVSQNRINQANA